MDEQHYCVTMKVYVWAETVDEATEKVIDDMNYLCRQLDGAISGFDHPTAADAVVDMEV